MLLDISDTGHGRQKRFASSITAKDNVVECAGNVDTGFAGHAGRIIEIIRKSSLTPLVF